MSFDGVSIHSMIHELAETFVSGWALKIYQSYESKVILVTRTKGKNHKLSLLAHPSYAHMQLPTIIYSNPETPPNFVMMLRKFLDGAILETIQQTENDHVIYFTFSRRDELGDLQNTVLVVESTGHHSIIVLVNQSPGKVLGTIKHIEISRNSYRPLLLEAVHIELPKSAGLNLLTAAREEVFALLSTAPELNGRYLQQYFQGLGEDIADELSTRLLAQSNGKMTIWTGFWLLVTETAVPALTVTEREGYFIPIPYRSLVGEQATYATLSELLDTLYSGKTEKDRVKQRGGELIRKIEDGLKRDQEKPKKLQQTLTNMENAENYRHDGELLTASMTQVPRGTTGVESSNYYEENAPLRVSLNLALPPDQNA